MTDRHGHRAAGTVPRASTPRRSFASGGGSDLVSLQYFIATDEGGWAIWLSCHPGDLAGNEAALRELNAPDTTASTT